MGMVDRAILLSDPKFQEDNLHFLIKILLNNDYPLNLIFDNFGRRTFKISLKCLTTTKKQTRNQKTRKNSSPSHFQVQSHINSNI